MANAAAMKEKASAAKESAMKKLSKKKKEKDMEVHLKAVDLTGIKAEVVTCTQAELKKPGFEICVQPIHYDDFDKQLGKTSISLLVQTLVTGIMGSILRDASKVFLTIGESTT